MKNMLKEYLGSDYSNDHLRNFCLYWMKGSDTMPAWEDTEEGRDRYDEWRRKNDLDCMYMDGDMRADTLFSAWTPIKWVADCLNREKGMRFYKRTRDQDDPYRHLKLLADNRGSYLPDSYELVQLLDRFLELAEGRWNYILLPDRNMNSKRYSGLHIGDKSVSLFDEVPPMLYHIFNKESLGKYFADEDGQYDVDTVVAWIRREHLEMGFEGGNIDEAEIKPLVKEVNPSDAKWLTEENEICEALSYMIRFLEKRKECFA